MKWEPAAAMVLLLVLGVWVVYGPKTPHELRPGAQTMKFNLVTKGELEILEDPPGSGVYSFRNLYRNGFASPVISREQFVTEHGQRNYDRAVANAGNMVFRAFNISSWAGVVWVVVGFAGQGAFFGRMFLQWMVSERERRSVVPEAFWWLSLAGGGLLFAYFVWRQDVVGVLGQTSGVVIYARNIRLIYKHRQREARKAVQGIPGNG